MHTRHLLRLLSIQAACLWLTAFAQPQDLTRVEAHITSVTTGTVYLDRGLDAGIRVDDVVTMFLDTGLTADGRVRSVTRTSARVELLPGALQPGVGGRAEIMIPSARLGPLRPGEHPPWEAPNPAWDPSRPLLAPAFGTTPEERESTTSGRIYTRFSGTFDRQANGSDYYLVSLGLDARRTNPFGKGGELELAAEAFERVDDVAGQPYESEGDFTLRRLSYRVGGEAEEPTRWEFGRFLQHEFPELGVLDGIEWSQRTSGGSAFGASFGAMPEPFPTMPTDDDIQAAVFYRWTANRERTLTWGNAYQNTWHRGEQDRNLFVSTLDWAASRLVNVHASAWVDYYGPGDTIKPDGFELTEFNASASWRTSERSSLSVYASARHYPEMLRTEFVAMTPEQILDDHLNRVGTGWSGMLGTHTRASARLDLWQDQDDSGQTYDATLGWRDLLWRRGELSVGANYSEGTYSSGPGGRISATRNWDAAFGSLTYSYSSYDQKAFSGTSATVANQSVFASLDVVLGKSWELSLYADRRFGDQIDSWDVGLGLQLGF